eukprot:14362201-Ditylum_brightwellii.AAC.1
MWGSAARSQRRRARSGGADGGRRPSARAEPHECARKSGRLPRRRGSCILSQPGSKPCKRPPGTSTS